MLRKSMVISGILCAALAMSACSSGGGDASGETIKIGTALPLSGQLASFGTLIQTGYQDCVADVNKDGGVNADGTNHKIELVVRDSESDSAKSAEAAQALVLDEGVVALLGAVTPPLQIPVSTVADKEKIPMVGSFTPVQAWLAGNPEGWKYAWNIFFDEGDMTSLQFQVADRVETNKKVALFTDNAVDGEIMGGLWEKKAPEYGYEVAYHATFPVGTTDYSQYITQLKSSGADTLITIMTPPDAMALWKQMAASKVNLQLAFSEKAGSNVSWPDALGAVAEGTIATDYFLPSDNTQGADLKAKYAKEVGDNVEASGSVLAYSICKVLTDAITRADSTDADAINDAVAKSSGVYPSGYEMKFEKNHSGSVQPVAAQWIGREGKQVFPIVKGIEPVVPVAGLQ